jgi:hypothetical protein
VRVDAAVTPVVQVVAVRVPPGVAMIPTVVTVAMAVIRVRLGRGVPAALRAPAVAAGRVAQAVRLASSLSALSVMAVAAVRALGGML